MLKSRLLPSVAAPLVETFHKVRRGFGRDPDVLLVGARGVIHVGANAGQERAAYARRAQHVLWVEPLPDVFAQLQANIEPYPTQRAVQYLVTDRDDEAYTLHVSSNNGASSSILPFREHGELWPEVTYTDAVQLRSVTLPSLIRKERVPLDRYDALVLDTQGSELLVLEGAAGILDRFTYIKVEAPDFEAYEGCCMVREVTSFLAAHGYREVCRREFAYKHGVGAYYDVVYRREG